MSNLLLIWQDKFTKPRYFLIPSAYLTEADSKKIHKFANTILSEEMDDSEYYDLWNLKASVTKTDAFIPSDVSEYWRHRFLQFEKQMPICSEISDVVSIGSSV